ncbi:MAG: hypothetical protein L6Q92_08575 [Phycisphaerae bacterium]|nr:hypothetical protein [Phycisphaerae bacterium]
MSVQPMTHDPPSTSVTPPRRRTSRRKLAAALLLSVALSLAGAELFFRLAMNVTNVPYYFWDPVIGIRRAPNQSGAYTWGGHVNGRFRFNAQGWNHSRDYVVVKPPHGRRVCLVGDSFVESLQVQPDETMYALAEKAMSRPERPVEWYAFGCSGFGAAQNYNVIRHYALDYQPDVVVMFFTENDVHDCSPYITKLEPYVSSYELDERDELRPILSGEYRPAAWRRIVSRSALVRFAWIHLQNKIARSRAPAAEAALILREGAQTLPSSSREKTDARERSWRLIEKLLTAARDECRRQGATFAVVFRGCRTQLRADFEHRPYVPMPRSEDPWCLGARVGEMGREFIGPICGRLGIPYLDLTDALMQEARQTGRRHDFEGDAHFSPTGHAAAAKAMAAWIEPMLRSDAADRNDAVQVRENSGAPEASEPSAQGRQR